MSDDSANGAGETSEASSMQGDSQGDEALGDEETLSMGGPDDASV